MVYTINLQEKALSSKERNKLDDKEFGIPEERKYPLNDEAHVRAAVKFFNKVEPKYEESLARRIIKRIKELNLNIQVGEDNKLSKYYKSPKKESTILVVESYKNPIPLQDKGKIINKLKSDKLFNRYNFNVEELSDKEINLLIKYKDYIDFILYRSKLKNDIEYYDPYSISFSIVLIEDSKIKFNPLKNTLENYLKIKKEQEELLNKYRDMENGPEKDKLEKYIDNDLYNKYEKSVIEVTDKAAEFIISESKSLYPDIDSDHIHIYYSNSENNFYIDGQIMFK